MVRELSKKAAGRKRKTDSCERQRLLEKKGRSRSPVKTERGKQRLLGGVKTRAEVGDELP